VCFFGEGALGQGLLYEELNLAQLWKLPVIFVCENNGYNEYTLFSESTAGDVSARADAFGMANETADGQNVRDVYAVAQKYIERARKGDGPAFLQFKTYRYHGHHVGDIARAYYRPKAEEQEWVTQRDPVTLHGEWLMANSVADRAALDAIQEELIKEMDAAMEFGVNASYPDPNKVDQDIYA
jgi:TPP-dependent pyruvate/acetoin dehydrogenase alpha subunit